MLATALSACQPAALGPSPAGLDQARLTIASQSGASHDFVVEVAATPEQQRRGLMFRESLAPDRGMIFPYDPPQRASFWMENTPIGLDLLFIAPGGRIESIAANAIPYSRDSIVSQGEVEAVLEVPGGRSAELGIKPGDAVRWSR